MKEELKDIKVNKIPNGYTLDFDGQSYMYYNLKSLLEGIMYHVGLEELGCIDNETIQDFLTAAIVWKADDGKTTKEIMKLQTENESLRSMCTNYQKKIKHLQEKLANGGGQKKGSHLAPTDDDEDE